MTRKVNGAVVVVAALAGLLGARAQEPKQGPVPQQLPVEEQNQIMKLQLEAQKVINDYGTTGCAQVSQKAQKDYADLQTKINDAVAKGLKSMNLDPTKYDVNQGTFYIVERPTPPTAPATPPATQPKK